MKRPEIKLIRAFLLGAALAFASFGNALYAKSGTVIIESAELYENIRTGKVVARLPLATVVNIEKTEQGFCRVSGKNIRGWIRRSDLEQYDGSRFSNLGTRIALSPRVVRENGEWQLVYFYKGRMVRYSVDARVERSSQKLDEVSEIYPSPRNDIFLIEGVTTNRGEVHNLAIFSTATGRMSYVGSFPEEAVKIKRVTFSPDADFLSVIYQTASGTCAAVYRTDSGELVGTAKAARYANWIGRTVVFNNSKSFWAFDMGRFGDGSMDWSKESGICSVNPEWVSYEGDVETASAGDRLYIDGRESVFILDVATVKAFDTPYKSLLFSPDRSLNYYMRGESAVLRNVKENRNYGDFSGSDPKIDFLFFAGTNIVAKRKYEKVEALFLYNQQGGEVYRYKAIDTPMAIGESGILAEFSAEKDMVMIAVENPERGEFYFILDKE